MNRRLKIVSSAILALAAAPALAGTVYSKAGANDGNNQTSFNTGNGWEGGDVPAKGNDYVWQASGNFRTRPRNWSAITDTFAGDSLTFTGGYIVLKTTNPLETSESAMNQVVFPNLILSGLTAFQHSNDANALARIGGNITVNNSFMVLSTVGTDAENSHRDIAFLANFKSDDPAVVITAKQSGNYSFASCPNVIRLLGDNAQYKGKWAVQNRQASNTAEAMVLSVESATALGDAPSSMMPDAVTLSNNGALAVSESLCETAPFSPVNRGLTVGSPAGRLTTIGASSWATTMPITGTGSLVKSGLGTVTLCGEYTAGGITVESGSLGIASGFTAPLGMPDVRLEEGAGFVISAAYGSVDITGMTIPEATEFGLVIGNTIVAGAGSRLPEGKIKIALVRPTDTSIREGVYELLKVSAGQRVLTLDDFDDVTTIDVGPRSFKLDVRAAADGMTALVAVCNPLVSSNAEATGDGSKWWLNTVKSGDVYFWDNEDLVKPGFDYLIQSGVYLRTANGSQSSSSFEFPGESLTLYGNGTLSLKSKKITFKDLRLGPSRQIVASGYTSGEQVQSIAGRLTTLGSVDSAAVALAGMRTQGINLEAECFGCGPIQLSAYATSNADLRTNVWVTVSGDNSSFKGRFDVHSSYGNASTLGVTCRIAEGGNLGGPMSAFTPNGISVRNNSGLMPETSMTLNAKNRGIYLGLARLITPAGVDLTLGETLSLDGTLVKEGEGRLVLDCPVRFGANLSTVPSGNNVVLVREGGLKIARAEAVSKLSVTFSKRGVLWIDPETEDQSLKTNGIQFSDAGSLSLADGVLAVGVDMHGTEQFSGKGFSLPICTVGSDLAARLRGKIAVQKIKGANGVVREELLGDGTSRFWVDVSAAGLIVVFK